eukprot:GCRY01000526.1.p1 GENE.GCRY01000526.1~~GCRY01000526.1.p1  ORF type:complete len:250 (-),score=31.57 GCRY01000526.1:563-1312(-)
MFHQMLATRSLLLNGLRSFSRSLRDVHFSLLGPPCCGKGTQSRLLNQDFDILNVSVGDLLRKEVNQQTTFGEQIKTFMESGELVPSPFLKSLLAPILSNAKGANVLFDGFPRSIEQKQIMDQLLSSLNEELDFVVYLAVSDTTIIDRLNNRFIHPQSGRIYDSSFQKPQKWGVDDLTGEPLVKRFDDTADHLQQRLNTFHECTEPLLAIYEKEGKLLRMENENSKNTYPKLKKVLEEALKKNKEHDIKR